LPEFEAKITKLETEVRSKHIIKALMLRVALLYPILAQAEILAMLNYESKPKQTPRREGLAIIDVDPASKNFTKMIADIPLPPTLVAHHIFYNKDASKAYLTSLGDNPLQVIDVKTKYPYRLKTIKVPDCNVGEDMFFF
jgi:hypothetical protein